MGRWWRWALVSPDGVAPSRMVSVSASVNLPLHHKVQKLSSGTGSPGWSRKKGRKTVVVKPFLQARCYSFWPVNSVKANSKHCLWPGRITRWPGLCLLPLPTGFSGQRHHALYAGSSVPVSRCWNYCWSLCPAMICRPQQCGRAAYGHFTLLMMQFSVIDDVWKKHLPEIFTGVTVVRARSIKR